ncbi:hypothetical protein [Deminuibacter soli]|uniref:Uncharacterized protein n=1 Tax=Deminuibacter soli TaxID=2291815 RepID=A0A3E1NQD5_9BACT|nr:hypothetical protein [Deminuibacter soli]RFM30008.1 hypothetical protein DXN05_03280 [Deminuibacter soli]
MMPQPVPLPPLPAAGMPACTYGVIIRISNNGNEQQVHYETQLNLLKRLPDSSLLYQLNRGQVYVNQQAPSTLMDQLADTCGKVLYPLQAVTTLSGDFFAVANTAAIAQRWEATQQHIQQYYNGSIAEDTLQYMQRATQSNAHLYESLRQDWLMAVYFACWRRQPGQTTPVYLPVIPYTTPVCFAATTSYIPPGSDTPYFTIEQTGEYADARSAEDLEQERPAAFSRLLYGKHTPVAGTMHYNCRLYDATGIVQSITGETSISLPGSGTKTISLEMYHMPERDQPALQTAAQEVHNDKPLKRRSLFSLFR